MGITIAIDNLDDMCALMCDNRIPGGRIMGSGTNSGRRETGVERIEASTGAPSKRASKLFADNYTEARQHINRYGTEEQTMFNTLNTAKDAGMIGAKTYKDIQQLIDKEQKTINVDEQIGAISAERAKQLRAALKIVQRTLTGQVKSEKEWRRDLKIRIGG